MTNIERDDEESIAKTFEDLSIVQKKAYKRTFLEEHWKEIEPYCQGQSIHKDLLNPDLCLLEDNIPVRGFFRSLIRMLNRWIFTLDENVEKIASSFTFGHHRIFISYQVEASMQVIYTKKLYMYRELFRESSSIKDVARTEKNLIQICSLYKPKLELVNKTEKDEMVKLLMAELVEEISKQTTLTISGIFKKIVRWIAPMFPSDYLDMYITIGKMEDSRIKLVLARFMMAFLVPSVKRGRLEVGLCFLNKLITVPESQLTFKNVSIVFTPLFFIDGAFQKKADDYKTCLEALQQFLEFAIENAPAIFLINTNK